MQNNFSRTLALLRKERGISQRTAALELGISQALLSHYENGAREPGLEFVNRACDYYHVSADFLLGRSLSRTGTTILDAESLFDANEGKGNQIHGTILSTLAKKLIVNSISMLFDLLGKTGNKEAISAATRVFSSLIYKMFRHLYRAPGIHDEDFFSVSISEFNTGLSIADTICSEVEYVNALDAHAAAKKPFPDMSRDALIADFPGCYQSLLQIVHTTGERLNRTLVQRGDKLK